MYYKEPTIESTVKRLASAKYARALIAHEDGRLDDAFKLASDAAYLEPTNLTYGDFSDRMKNLLEQVKEAV